MPAGKKYGIYTHTCDLCGTEHPREDLRRLGQVRIREEHIVTSDPKVEGPTADVCEACKQRPIAELAAFLVTPSPETKTPPRTVGRVA